MHIYHVNFELALSLFKSNIQVYRSEETQLPMSGLMETSRDLIDYTYEEVQQVVNFAGY